MLSPSEQATLAHVKPTANERFIRLLLYTVRRGRVSEMTEIEVISGQGDIFWYDFAVPRGSEPGYEHPVVVIQGDAFNRSRLDTTVVVVLTTNTKHASMPGNVLLPKKATGPDRDSVANITQVQTVEPAFRSPPSASRCHRGRLRRMLAMHDDDRA